MEKIFYDENGNYSFDFMNAIEVFEPHEFSQKTTMLADVDFVIDTKEKIIFLEYKFLNMEEWHSMYSEYPITEID